MARRHCLLLVLALMLVAQSAAHGSDDAMIRYIEGLQSAEEGDLKKAILEMRAALDADSTVGEISRELARFLIEDDRPEEAIAPARRAVRLSPDDAESHWLLGRSLAMAEQDSAAIGSLRQAWELDRRKRDYLISLLMALDSTGDLRQALDLLTPSAGGMEPDTPSLLLTRGNLRTRLGHSGKALEDFLHAMERSPGYPGAADRVLALCWRLGPSDSTAAALSRAVAIEPDQADLRRELARCLVTLNREDEALPHLEWLLQQRPQDASIQMQIGVIYFGKERLPEAIGLFRSARKLNPNLPDSGDWLWRALNRADSLRAALSVADELVRASPDRPSPHWCRAISLARLNRSVEALAALDEVNRLDPKDRDARLLAAALLEEAGKADAAREQLTQVLAFLPTDREVLFRLGVLDERAGRLEPSLAWFRRLIEAYPEDAQALNYAGYMLADRGMDLEQALAWIARAVSLDGENAAYLDSYGWVLYRMGRFAEGVDKLEHAAKIEPTEIEIQIHLAKAYRGAGREDAGRHVLERLLRDRPGDRRASELLQIWNGAVPDSGNRR